MSVDRVEDDIRQAEERYHARIAAGEEAGPELDAFCLELCRLYPTLSEEGRSDLRGSVARHEALRRGVFRWITGVADKMRTMDDAAWLDLGLAAASLENSAVDQRDWLLSVAFLYVAAKDVGLDPKPHFQRFAKLSSSEQPLGGWTPVAEALGDFHAYAVIDDAWHFYRRWRTKHPLNDAGSGDEGRS